jgi:hypothetical protein
LSHSASPQSNQFFSFSIFIYIQACRNICIHFIFIYSYYNILYIQFCTTVLFCFVSLWNIPEIPLYIEIFLPLIYGCILLYFISIQSLYSQPPDNMNLGYFQSNSITNIVIRNNLLCRSFLFILCIRKMKLRSSCLRLIFGKAQIINYRDNTSVI